MSERPFDLASPDVYRHWTVDKVRFADQDGNGHVNNAAIAVYVEGGRVAYGTELLPGLGPDRRVVVARVAIDYLAEAHYPGEIRVGTRLIRLGRSSFALGSGVFKDGRCIATADSILVLLTGTTPTPIGGPARMRMEALLAA